MKDNSILEGLKDAVRHARGDGVRRDVSVIYVENPVDVKSIREGMGLTQREFADKFGFSIGTLQNWEQGRRRPAGVNRNFLKVIEKLPDEVQRVLAA